MPLEIRHVSLRQLFSHHVPFYMARYQRHYEWGTRQMEHLLEDLAQVYERHQEAPNAGAYHFFGNVILFAHPSGHLEVVDGQQRLTSLAALMASARDISDDRALRAELAPLLTISDGRDMRPRLRLHRGDDAFLRTHVLPDGATNGIPALSVQSHVGADCLRLNTRFAREFLQRWSSAEVSAFMRFVLQQSRFVEIQVGSEDDAFRIFETVNSRGSKISGEDVLRFALIEYATDDPEMRDEFLDRWDAMEADLGPKGMKRLATGWRTRLTKGKSVNKPLHRTIIDSFGSPAEARAFLDIELSADLSIFKQLNSADITLPDGPDKHRIDHILRSLLLVNFDEWIPVASELVARGRHNPARLVSDLQRVERLVWFYYLTSDKKGVHQDRRDRFTILMKIAADAGTFAAMPSRSLLSDDERGRMRQSLQGRLDAKWVPLRSLLVRLEMALTPEDVPVDRSSLTIEHILPRSATTKYWRQLFGDDPDLYADYVDQIGNLCLVSSEVNTELGSKIYPTKRHIFLKNRIPDKSPLAADIATEAHWTRDVITRRSKWMRDVVCEMFQLDIPQR